MHNRFFVNGLEMA